MLADPGRRCRPTAKHRIPGLADAIEAFRAKDGRDLRDVFRSISRDTVVAVTVNLGGLDADVQTALLHLVCAQQFVAILVAVEAKMRQKTLQMKNLKKLDQV